MKQLRKVAKRSREKAAERGDLSSNCRGEVERAKEVPSLDTILGMAKGLQMSPAALLVDKEDDPNLRNKTQALVERATPEQLTLLYRIAKVIVSP